jgi:hypothetical protein
VQGSEPVKTKPKDIDTQREEFLIKWKQFPTMTDRWRLVGRDVLYEISNDQGQKINHVAAHHEVVDSLHSAYEKWWKNVSPYAGDYSIKIGIPFESPVRLNVHDLHSEKGINEWSQQMDRAKSGNNGFYAIDVVFQVTIRIFLSLN